MRTKGLKRLVVGLMILLLNGCLAKSSGPSSNNAPPRLRTEGGVVYVKDSGDSSQKQICHLNLQDGKETVLYQYSTTVDKPNPVFNSGQKTKITFADKEGSNGDYDIFTYDIATGKKEGFTSNNASGTDRHPSFDVSGSKMSFLSARSSPLKICFIDLNGDRALISRDDTDVDAPVISPDGSKIAYIKSIAGPPIRYELWICQVSGSQLLEPIKLSFDTSVHNPAWSPDGQTIAVESYVSSSETHYIAIIHPFEAAPVLQRVTFDWVRKAMHRHPAWSGDGKWLFFTGTLLKSGQHDLFAVAVDEAVQKGDQAQYYLVNDGGGGIEEPCWAGDLQLGIPSSPSLSISPTPGPTP